MVTLLDDPASVQAQSLSVGPLPHSGEPFHPGPADLAYDLAYTLARLGEPAQSPRLLDRAIRRAHFAGSVAGRKARNCDAARELGRTLGLIGGLSEPFPTYTADEVQSFRAGFAEGVAELTEGIEFDAWVASAEADRLELAFADPITDADVCQGGVS